VPTTIAVPPDRAAVARAVAEALTPGLRVALTTHVNADGDGIGSEVALWHLLTARGLVPVIANPTPVPTRFGFLMPAGADRSAQAAREIERADVLIVLDISDLGRLGDLGRAVSKRRGATVCVDHHVSPASTAPGFSLTQRRSTMGGIIACNLALPDLLASGGCDACRPS
jgi:phosphoesterase RecJ-like protein